MDDDARSSRYVMRLAEGLGAVDRAAWDAAANPPGRAVNPFVSWDFLEALEASGCVSPRTGWGPRHALLEDEAGRLVAAAPAYLKSHSRGEYVFDFAWAEAFERAGGQYYPKLLVAVPFTPVTGPRLLATEPQARRALLSGLVQATEAMELSSLHILFPDEADDAACDEAGLLMRQDQQFIWENRGYASYDDFLADLASRKRKALRKERATAQEGVEIVRLTGADITEDHWDAFYEFYVDTGARKWGTPYLNRFAFSLLGERMADRMVLVMAKADGRWVAGALNFLGSDAIYGRYWGRIEDRPCLHFEVCYHQAVDEAIARGLARVEAGAQGEHKLARGYGPAPVYSRHWIGHGGFRAAVADYLAHERRAVESEIAWLKDAAPFKKGS